MKKVLVILLIGLTLCGCAAGGQVAMEQPKIAVERVFVEAYTPPLTVRPIPVPTPTPTPEPTPTPTPEPTTPVYVSYHICDEEDLILAAKVAYLEARGKGEQAYRAVLCVIYNRCMATRFGGGVTTISTEVFRSGQFSVINHKNFDTLEPPEEIVEYARDIFYNGNIDIPYNILFFCASRLGKNWGGRKFYEDIGGNLFFYGNVD
ncbi:MAG: cell wall hydrolase [Eubacteriales bacterium]|nr:cell wall hydrolase [Eubacteriales bacterium]